MQVSILCYYASYHTLDSISATGRRALASSSASGVLGSGPWSTLSWWGSVTSDQLMVPSTYEKMIAPFSSDFCYNLSYHGSIYILSSYVSLYFWTVDVSLYFWTVDDSLYFWTVDDSLCIWTVDEMFTVPTTSDLLMAPSTSDAFIPFDASNILSRVEDKATTEDYFVRPARPCGHKSVVILRHWTHICHRSTCFLHDLIINIISETCYSYLWEINPHISIV